MELRYALIEIQSNGSRDVYKRNRIFVLTYVSLMVAICIGFEIYISIEQHSVEQNLIAFENSAALIPCID